MLTVLEARPRQAALERLADRVAEKTAFDGIMAMGCLMSRVFCQYYNEVENLISGGRVSSE